MSSKCQWPGKQRQAYNCGGPVDEDWTCLGCGYNPIEDDYDPTEHADLEDLEDFGDLVELGPTGREALG